MSANDLALAQKLDIPLKITKELCAGKTYIVTGANVGLGLEASRHLVQIGAGKVIMAVRNVEAGESARADVEKTTGVADVAEVWALDLSSYDSVRAFASRAQKLGRIEALVNNAAVAGMLDAFVEGHRTPVTVNVLSTLYLTLLLLPKLREDAAKFGYTPRVGVVTSGTAFDMGAMWEKIAGDPIVDADANEGVRRALYPISKLMEILAVRHLAKILPLEQHNVIINTVNPGLCMTSLSRHAPAALKDEIKSMWEQNGRTAEQGSRTLLGSAVGGKDSHGSYMDDCEPANNLVPEWIDDKASKQCWEAVQRELSKVDATAVKEALGTAS